MKSGLPCGLLTAHPSQRQTKKRPVCYIYIEETQAKEADHLFEVNTADGSKTRQRRQSLCFPAFSLPTNQPKAHQSKGP